MCDQACLYLVRKMNVEEYANKLVELGSKYGVYVEYKEEKVLVTPIVGHRWLTYALSKSQFRAIIARIAAMSEPVNPYGGDTFLDHVDKRLNVRFQNTSEVQWLEIVES